MSFRAFLTVMCLSVLLSSCSSEEHNHSKPGSISEHSSSSAVSNGATTDGFDTGLGTGGNPTRNTKGKKKKQKGSLIELLSHPDRSLKESIAEYLPEVNGSPSPLDLMKGAMKALDDKHRDYDGAEVLLTEIIRLDPNNGEAYYQRGRARCNTLQLRDDEALEDFARARSLGFVSPPMCEYQARIYDSRHQPDKAIQALSEAIKINPKQPSYFRSRATMYLGLNKKDLAKRDYDKAIELDPKESYVYMLRGQLHESMQQYDAALRDYKSAANSKFADQKFGKRLIALKGQAALLQKLGRYKEAVEVLNTAQAFEKNDEELFALRGQCYAELKQYDQAIADFTRSIDLAPTFYAKTFLQRSKAYDQVGKKELAEKDRLEAKRLQAAPAERGLYEMPKRSAE